MTGPGGSEVGRVSVRVVPDVSGFRDDVKRELEKIGDVEITVDVVFDVDREQLRAELESIRTPTISVPVELDTAQYRAQLAALGDESAGRVEVPVDADTSGFRAEVAAAVAAVDNDQLTLELELVTAEMRAEYNALKNSIDGDQLELGIDLDTAKFRAEMAALTSRRYEVTVNVDTDRTAAAFSSLGQLASGLFTGIGSAISSAFSNASSGISGLGSRISGVAGTVAGLAGTLLKVSGVASLVAVAGAGITAAWATAATAIAAVPTALALIGAPIAAVALGMDGIKRAAATLTPEFDRMKASVSATFERGLKPAFESIRTLMPAIESGMNGIARALSFAASNLTSFVSSGANAVRLEGVFQQVGRAIYELSPAINDIIEAFLRLASRKSGFDALTGAVKEFGRTFKEGVIQTVGDGSMDRAFNGLEKLLGAVARAFQGLMVNGIRAFAGAAPGLTRGLDGITSFFGKFNYEKLGGAVGSVFEGIGTALAKVKPETVKKIEDAFVKLGDVFKDPKFQDNLTKIVDALPGVIDLVGELVDIFVSNAKDITEFVDSISRLAGVLDLISKMSIPEFIKFTLTGELPDRPLTGSIEGPDGKGFWDGLLEGMPDLTTLFDGLKGILNSIDIGTISAPDIAGPINTAIDSAKTQATTKIGELRDAINGGLAGVTTAVAALAAAFAALPAALSQVSAAVAPVSNAMLALGVALQNLQATLQVAATGFTTFAANLATIGNGLLLLNQSLLATQLAVTNMLTGFTNLGTSLVTFNTNMTLINQTLLLLNQSLLITQTALTAMLTGLTALGTSIVTFNTNLTLMNQTLLLINQTLLATQLALTNMLTSFTGLGTVLALFNANMTLVNQTLLLLNQTLLVTQTTLANMLIGFTNLGTALTTLNTNLTLANQALLLFNQALLITQFAVQSLVVAVQTGFAQIPVVVQTAMAQVVAATQAGWAQVVAVTQSSMAQVAAVTQSGWSQVVSVTASSMAQVVAVVAAGMAVAVAAVAAGMAAIRSAVASGVAAIVAAMAAGMAALVAAGVAAMAALLAALNFGRVVSMIASGVGQAVASVRSMIGGFASAGASAVAALASAIASGASAVISAAASIASQAIGAAKRALGIASPSKVFLAIGDDTVAGFVKGLDSDAPAQQMRSMIDKMIAEAERFANTNLSTDLVGGFDTRGLNARLDASIGGLSVRASVADGKAAVQINNNFYAEADQAQAAAMVAAQRKQAALGLFG